MDEHILVDNQEPVMELVRVLDRERIAVLRIEGGHIGGVEQFAFRRGKAKFPLATRGEVAV